MSKEAVTKAPSGRPQRQPVGYRNRLTVYDKDPNYVYRWVNANIDQGDRVALFEQAGYEKVPKGTHRIGNSRVSTASPLGDVETMPGGGGDTMVLMRQKREYYDEDQRAKQKQIDDSEKAQMKTPDGLYGRIAKDTPPQE